jgi:hypothetical protein
MPRPKRGLADSGRPEAPCRSSRGPRTAPLQRVAEGPTCDGEEFEPPHAGDLPIPLVGRRRALSLGGSGLPPGERDEPAERVRTAHERHAGGARVQEQLGDPCAEPSPVAPRLEAKRRKVIPVSMPDNGRGLHHQYSTIENHASEHVDVLAASRAGADAQGVIETAKFEGGTTTQREVGARAELPDREGEHRKIGRRIRERIDAGFEVLRPAHATVEIALSGRAQLPARHESGDAIDVRSARKARGQLRQPGRVDDHVIIGVRDDLSRRGAEPGIPGARKAGDRLRHQGHSGCREFVLNQIPGIGGARRIVDDENVEVRIVEGEDRLQCTAELGCPVPGADDDRDRGQVGGDIARGDARERIQGPVESGSSDHAVRRLEFDETAHCRAIANEKAGLRVSRG